MVIMFEKYLSVFWFVVLQPTSRKRRVSTAAGRDDYSDMDFDDDKRSTATGASTYRRKDTILWNCIAL